MSLYAKNSMEPGIRGIHAPKKITVRQVGDNARGIIEQTVAVIEEQDDGTILITAVAGVALTFAKGELP